jgi:hypothetical protein
MVLVVDVCKLGEMVEEHLAEALPRLLLLVQLQVQPVVRLRSGSRVWVAVLAPIQI